MMLLVGILLALIGASAAALCTAADGALLGVEPADGDEHASQRRERTHRALASARVISYVVSGVGTGMALRATPDARALASLIAVITAVVIVTVVETVPRTIGDLRGTPLLNSLGGFVRTVEALASPLVMLGEWIDRALLALLPPPEPDEEQRETSTEHFREVVQAEAGVPPAQRAILHRVFLLRETEVQQIMVPRVDIVALDLETHWSEVIDRVRSSQHSRLPVYEDTIDQIVGIVYAKDLLASVIADREPAGGWKSLVREATYIPESKAVDAQLRDFKAAHTHLAIVVDEYGGTAGLITIEDVLEEIVGDIRDEYDREEPAMESEDGKRFWVSGRVSLDDLSHVLGHSFEREGVTTVGGLIYDILGRVPRAGEELELEGFRVVVERVVRRRVERVYFERTAQVAGRGA